MKIGTFSIVLIAAGGGLVVSGVADKRPGAGNFQIMAGIALMVAAFIPGVAGIGAGIGGTEPDKDPYAAPDPPPEDNPAEIPLYTIYVSGEKAYLIYEPGNVGIYGPSKLTAPYNLYAKLITDACPVNQARVAVIYGPTATTTSEAILDAVLLLNKITIHSEETIAEPLTDQDFLRRYRLTNGVVSYLGIVYGQNF